MRLGEEKLYYIHQHLDEHITGSEIEREYEVGHLVLTQVKWYLEEGAETLVLKSGNLYVALYTSKSLNEVNRLRLVIGKQEMEIVQ